MSSRKREVFDELLDEVRRSQNATDRFDQAVADALGMNRTDMRCTDVLDREGPVTAGRLAEETGLTTGAITTVIDRLERAGVARRLPDPSDRRRVLVDLTENAREHGRSFYLEHARRAEQLYGRYTEAELRLILEFVRQSRELNERRAAEVEEATRAAASPGRRTSRPDAPG